jgi:predicted nucleotidyltransferase
VKTRELLDKNKQQILKYASENGIKNVRLFGSVVRGQDHLDSDIDLLVEIEDGRSLFDLIRFKQSVEELLGRKVDVVSDQAVHSTLKQYIIDEAVHI